MPVRKRLLTQRTWDGVGAWQTDSKCYRRNLWQEAELIRNWVKGLYCWRKSIIFATNLNSQVELGGADKHRPRPMFLFHILLTEIRGWGGYTYIKHSTRMTDWLELEHSIWGNLNLCSQVIVTIFGSIINYLLFPVRWELCFRVNNIYGKDVFSLSKKNSEVTIPIMGRQLHHEACMLFIDSTKHVTESES